MKKEREVDAGRIDAFFRDSDDEQREDGGEVLRPPFLPTE